jgi:hypothetical protein
MERYHVELWFDGAPLLEIGNLTRAIMAQGWEFEASSPGAWWGRFSRELDSDADFQTALRELKRIFGPWWRKGRRWPPEPTLLDCPNCRKPLVLLSVESYPGLAHLSSGELSDLPGEIRDELRDTPDANFAVIDAAGHYTCGWCGTTSRF